MNGGLRSDFDTFMQSYPTTADYSVVTRYDGAPQYTQLDDGTLSVQMHWVAGTTFPVPEDLRRERLGAVLTPYREGDFLILPTIFPGKAPLHPMMSWWAVLYILSMLARYQPAEWADCIDINRSPFANSIEYLLDEARIAVPDLVLTTLDQVSS